MALAYFIWRQSPDEQWRVHRFNPHLDPPTVWEGDDYQAELEECHRLNAERRRMKGEVKGCG